MLRHWEEMRREGKRGREGREGEREREREKEREEGSEWGSTFCLLGCWFHHGP